ncbi:MAG: PEP-CTERM sorting domain-containing protein [Gemmatimonadaceae bacterium]
MKLVRFSSVALAAAMMLPVVAHAQPVTLQFDGVKTAGGDMVGPAATGAYRAHRSAPTVGATFDLYCLDYDHAAQGTWSATFVTFAEATSGSAVAAANRQLGTEKVWGLAQLRAAAYLTTQFGAVGAGTADDNWDDVHGAIWSMFSTSVPTTLAMTTLASNAVTFAGGNASYDSFSLILDTRAFTTSTPASELNQAFISDDGKVGGFGVVPEPSTYALMGVGLFAIGFARRRRRSV